MNEDTEIRHLTPVALLRLSQFLDEFGWKELMGRIPSDPNNLNSRPKYKVEDIRLIESYAEKHRRSCTEILLLEWGTSGRVRPTLKTLREVLMISDLLRAATYVAVDLLNGPAPKQPVITSIPEPAASALRNGSDVFNGNPSSNVIPIPFVILQDITNNFNELPFRENGHKLGAGAFGSVYYGVLPDGTPVAVKKLVSDTVDLFKQFQTEVQALSLYRHPNLLHLLAYSCDSVEYCLVYEYMPNGSLQDQLAQGRQNGIPLSSTGRLDIAIGVSQGINYLHRASPPLIHRDIKSANILLDGNMAARLGDFGLVRTSPTGSKTHNLTSTIFGTSAYMAPEAFRGDISVKTDVFSLGVVLLELLTALPPYDADRDDADLVTFIEGAAEDNIEPLLEPAVSWEISKAESIFEIAKNCLKDKRKRPDISEVLSSLKELNNSVLFSQRLDNDSEV